MDTVNGADLCAFAASRAEGIVDGGKVIYYLDRAVRAGLFALHTANTAVGATLSGDRALFVV